MAADVFKIQGVVEVIADKAVRQLVVFKNAAVSTASSIKQNFAGIDRMLSSFSGFFTGMQFERLAKAMIGATISTQTFRTQMQLIVKDFEKVNNLIGFVEEYEAKTPFDLPELQKATVLFTKLTKVRDESIEKVPEYLKLAGEMSSIFDKPLEKATEGLFKTFSGSALGLTILRNNFAITKAELEKFGVAFDKSGRIKNFQLQLNQVEFAINQIIRNLSGFKMAEERSQTLAGRMSTLGSETYRAARAFGDYMAPAFGMLIERSIMMMQALQNLNPTIKTAVALFTLFAAVAGALIVSFGPMFFFFNQTTLGLASLARGMGGAAAASRTMAFVMLPAWTAIVRLLLPLFKALDYALSMLVFKLTGVGFTSMAASTSMSVFTGVLTKARVALYGIGGAFIFAFAKLNDYTVALEKLNREEEDRLRRHDPRKVAVAVAHARGQETPEDRDREISQRKALVELAKKEAEAKSLVAKATPLQKELFEAGLGSEGVKEDIKAVEASLIDLTRQRDKQDEMILRSFENFLKQGKTRVEALALATKSAAAVSLKMGPGQVQEVIARGERKKRGEDVFADGLLPFASEGQKKLLQVREELLKTLKVMEAFEGLLGKRKTVDEIAAELADIKSAAQLEEATLQHTFNRLVQLRQESYGKQGVLRDGFADVSKKVEKAMHDYADKLAEDRLQKVREDMENLEALGEITTAKRVDFIREQYRILQETAEEFDRGLRKGTARSVADAAARVALGGDVMPTSKMAKQAQRLQQDLSKVNKQIVDEWWNREIEKTRIEKGEFAARLMELDRDLAQRRSKGQDEIQITRFKEDQKKRIEIDRIRAVQAVEDAIRQGRERAETSRAETVRGRAERGIERGSRDYAGTQKAREAVDVIEETQTKAAMKREIEQVELDAKLNIELRVQLQATIKAIRDRYAAEKEARDEARRQRDEDFREKEEQQKRTDVIATAQRAQKSREFQLEGLKQQQAEGVEVSDQIIRVLRERYDMAVKIINAEAARNSIGKEGADLAQIEADRKMQILELTRSSTQEMREQLKLKRAEEDKRKEPFFKGGVMTFEEAQELEKKRSEENQARYRRMVEKEKMRTGGVGPMDREVAAKLGVPLEVQNAAFNPVNVKIDPIDFNLNLTLTQPDGTKTTARASTSTDRKNENKKTPESQKGKPKN